MVGGMGQTSGYWKAVSSRAMREALAAAHLDSQSRVMIALAIGALGVIGLAVWGSEGAAKDQLIFAGVVLAFYFLTVPMIYLVKIVTVPGSIHNEQSDHMLKLESALEATRAASDSSGPRPNMTIRDLFFHIAPDVHTHSEQSLWREVAREIKDKFSLGDLCAWGREISNSRRLPLAPIETKYWRSAGFTYWFFDGDTDAVQAHTFKERDLDGIDKEYADVQVNRAEVLAIWPEDEMPRQRLRFGDIVRRDEDQLITFYIEIFNRHPTKRLSDVICRIEALSDSDGNIKFERLALRTENQTGNRPKGRFNLDQSSNKLVAVCSILPIDMEDEIHILHAEKGKRILPSGFYRIAISASAPEGGELIETVLALETSPEPVLRFGY